MVPTTNPLPETMLTNHQWEFAASAWDMSLKITYLGLQPNHPGVNEFIHYYIRDIPVFDKLSNKYVEPH